MISKKKKKKDKKRNQILAFIKEQLSPHRYSEKRKPEKKKKSDER